MLRGVDTRGSSCPPIAGKCQSLCQLFQALGRFQSGLWAATARVPLCVRDILSSKGPAFCSAAPCPCTCLSLVVRGPPCLLSPQLRWGF